MITDNLLKAVKHMRGLTTSHLRKTIISADLHRVKREGFDDDTMLWAWASRMRPHGSSGCMVKAGILAFVAGVGPMKFWGDKDTTADALLAAAHAMKMELASRYKEVPKKGGLCYAAELMSDVVRDEGLDAKVLASRLRDTLTERHPDQGVTALILTLEEL